MIVNDPFRLEAIQDGLKHNVSLSGREIYGGEKWKWIKRLGTKDRDTRIGEEGSLGSSKYM